MNTISSCLRFWCVSQQMFKCETLLLLITWPNEEAGAHLQLTLRKAKITQQKESLFRLQQSDGVTRRIFNKPTSQGCSGTHWSAIRVSKNPKPSTCGEHHWQSSFYMTLNLSSALLTPPRELFALSYLYQGCLSRISARKSQKSAAITEGLHYSLTTSVQMMLKSTSPMCLLHPCLGFAPHRADVTVTSTSTRPTPLLSSPKSPLPPKPLIRSPGSRQFS